MLSKNSKGTKFSAALYLWEGFTFYSKPLRDLRISDYFRHSEVPLWD